MSVSIIINSTKKHTLDNCLLHSFLHNNMTRALHFLSLDKLRDLGFTIFLTASNSIFPTLCDNGEGGKKSLTDIAIS